MAAASLPYFLSCGCEIRPFNVKIALFSAEKHTISTELLDYLREVNL